VTDERPRILVVDDEPDTCANLQDILVDLGYQVDVAHDGPRALEMVERTPYDVALLDLKMPGMDGLELYRRIKQLQAGTVAIIVTAYAASDTAQSALQAGAWKILAKPVDLSRLLPLIDEAIEQPLVMIVDDDLELCHSLWDVLRERGYRVAMAHGVKSAQQKLGDKSYRVVLIDMKLPEGDGAEVFHYVRQASPEARTVLITGHRSELDQQVEKTLGEGASAVCYKPFDMGQLLSNIKQLTK
jgi:two-component system, NtrC family, response regulator HydG